MENKISLKNLLIFWAKRHRKNVYGDPIVVKDKTIIPVAKGVLRFWWRLWFR
jgi:hypothetical protein